MSTLTSRVPGLPRALALAAIIGGAAFLTKPAEAWWHGGFFIGVPPVVVGPAPAYPYYYPPAYYPPAYYPPAYYPYGYPYAAPAAAPAASPAAQTPLPSSSRVAYGSMCYAGVYHCAAPAQTPIGETCSCPGLGAPSYGSVQ